MPYWTTEEEKQLLEMLPEKDLQEIAKILNRSPDAVSMKCQRLGLAGPPRKEKKSSAKNPVKNDSFSATTTTPKLEPVKFEDAPSPNEMVCLLAAAVQRLTEPDVSPSEIKRLRLVVQGAKTYINLYSTVLWRLRHLESDFLAYWRHLAAQYETELERARNEEEKAKFKALLEDARQQIQELIDLGTAEPKKLREERKPWA
jgi:hypothetical protein